MTINRFTCLFSSGFWKNSRRISKASSVFCSPKIRLKKSSFRQKENRFLFLSKNFVLPGSKKFVRETSSESRISSVGLKTRKVSFFFDRPADFSVFSLCLWKIARKQNRWKKIEVFFLSFWEEKLLFTFQRSNRVEKKLFVLKDLFDSIFERNGEKRVETVFKRNPKKIENFNENRRRVEKFFCWKRKNRFFSIRNFFFFAARTERKKFVVKRNGEKSRGRIIVLWNVFVIFLFEFSVVSVNRTEKLNENKSSKEKIRRFSTWATFFPRKSSRIGADCVDRGFVGSAKFSRATRNGSRHWPFWKSEQKTGRLLSTYENNLCFLCAHLRIV